MIGTTVTASSAMAQTFTTDTDDLGAEAHYREKLPGLFPRWSPCDSAASLEYRKGERIRRLKQHVGIRWLIHLPYYRVRFELRPWQAKLRRRRGPAPFRIYVAAVLK